MHENGKSISNEHIRDGTVIRKGLGQYFDFEAQGGLVVSQRPFEVQPGDSFRTTCSYDAEPGESWGLASSDEMCIAYLFYYPRQIIPVEDDAGIKVGEFQPLCGFNFDEFLPGCGVDYFVTPDFFSFDQTERFFGTPNGMCAVAGNAEGSASNRSATRSLSYIGLLVAGLLALFN